MNRSIVRTVLFALALAVVPALGSAQQAGGPEAPGSEALPPEADAWLTEIQQIHVQLAQLQEQALQDPELAALQDSLGNHIRVAMEAIDPALPESMTRIQQMEEQAAQAQARSDAATLEQLRAEARLIEQQFLSVQEQALQQPALAAELSTFQTRLQEKILAASPDAPRLLARFQELEQKLTALSQQQEN